MKTMMSTVTIVTLVTTAGVALLACNDDEVAQKGAGSPDSGSKAEYAISCKGEVSMLGVGTGRVGVRCGDGDSGLRCGDNCGAQAIEIRYEPPASFCQTTNVYAWDGAACIAYPTQNGGDMRCKGDGCASLFKSEAECRNAFASCPPRQ